MIGSDVVNNYMESIAVQVCDINHPYNSWSTLFKWLFATTFEPIYDSDLSRARDGVQLRYDYCDITGISIQYLFGSLNECTLLELMVALSIRCEDDIIGDPRGDFNPGRLFWMMIFNMGLSDMCDSRFEEDYVSYRLMRLKNHEYPRNGEGSLFIIEDPCLDVRKMPIWPQMCHYINEHPEIF